MELENGDRIESKIDKLAEDITILLIGQATMKERTEQLTARFEGFANARDATCPLRPAIARLGDKVDHCSGKMTEVAEAKVKNEELAKVAKKKAEDIEEEVRTIKRFAKWFFATLVTLIGLTATVIGILVATHVI